MDVSIRSGVKAQTSVFKLPMLTLLLTVMCKVSHHFDAMKMKPAVQCNFWSTRHYQQDIRNNGPTQFPYTDIAYCFVIFVVSFIKPAEKKAEQYAK